MGHFRGAEPLVGEIVGLRTFRVEQSGELLPLYSPGSWTDGGNTAECAPPTGPNRRPPHAVPSDECECGFYAYGSREAAAQNRHMRHVQAIVSCWGGVVAGTQGIRAEHARIDALWLSGDAPDWLRRRVASRYSSARMYGDVDEMLAEHPLSELPCYGPISPLRRGWSLGGVAIVALVLTLGVLPIGVLRGTPLLWALWLSTAAGAVALTLWFLVGTRRGGHLMAAFVAASALGWLVAPAFGLYGWLLRLPLLPVIVVLVGGRLLELRPRHFPIVAPRPTRTFLGVRS